VGQGGASGKRMAVDGPERQVPVRSWSTNPDMASDLWPIKLAWVHDSAVPLVPPKAASVIYGITARSLVPNGRQREKVEPLLGHYSLSFVVVICST
jgi:hypothetical protein